MSNTTRVFNTSGPNPLKQRASYNVVTVSFSGIKRQAVEVTVDFEQLTVLALRATESQTGEATACYDAIIAKVKE